jgi:hypothetical protein
MSMAKPNKTRDLELLPDAWPRFERFIRDVAKAGPQHRKPSQATKGRLPKNKDRRDRSK